MPNPLDCCHVVLLYSLLVLRAVKQQQVHLQQPTMAMLNVRMACKPYIPGSNAHEDLQRLGIFAVFLVIISETYNSSVR